MKAISERWDPINGVGAPCADIEFAYFASGSIRALMRFSQVVDGAEHDLELVFRGVIAMHWESESYGIKPLPEPLPKLQTPRWSNWSFPLIKVRGSEWLAQYSDRDPAAAERAHFALVSMNDELQVLALPEVSAVWVPTSEDPMKSGFG